MAQAGYNVDNYNDGGSLTAIGGELRILTGGKITPNSGTQAATIADATGAAGANPTQAEYAALISKFNAVLLALENVGILANS